MGFAKYREDDWEIYLERIDNRENRYSSSIPVTTTYKPVRITYSKHCPFCSFGCNTSSELKNHVVINHGGDEAVLYVNGRRVYNRKIVVSRIHSVILYYFGAPTVVTLTDDFDRSTTVNINEKSNEYNLLRPIGNSLFSQLIISCNGYEFEIVQNLDIGQVSIDKILSNYYVSYLFDYQFAEEQLSPLGCLIYMKLLLNEGESTEMAIDRIGYNNFDASRDVDELYWYHFLDSGSFRNGNHSIPENLWKAFFNILNGEYKDAGGLLQTTARSNDKYACQLLLNTLQHDLLGRDFISRKYTDEGNIINQLIDIVTYLADYEKKDFGRPRTAFKEWAFFRKYPLIDALFALDDSLHGNGFIDSKQYALLRTLTPFAALSYCSGMNDNNAVEKVLKSITKEFAESQYIKQWAFDRKYKWIDRRIRLADKDLYKKALLTANAKLPASFSERFVNSFPFDDKVKITPLGGESGIGASCFVISYNGFNIMLDCGIDPGKYDDEAYPALDEWNDHIDYIIVSHAHVDHSGGVPKAHAMWKDAEIICTTQTMIFMRYIFADMAKEHSNIITDFELDNVSIEKEVMIDTMKSIHPIQCEEWISLGNDIHLCLHPAGHIAGAAMIELHLGDKKLLYTGDFCNYSQGFMGGINYHSLPTDVDFVLMEGTYLSRAAFDWNKQREELEKAILSAINHKRAILLPAASIGRSQELACIIGEMKLCGKIPENIPLYLGGMAIPITTQIIPYMNEHYANVIGQFEEFNGVDYPPYNSIVIASSGNMTRGSASYKIHEYWKNNRIKHQILTSGYLDEESERSRDFSNNRNMDIVSYSLPTHVDVKGLKEFITYTEPKVLAMVHRGNHNDNDFTRIKNDITNHFNQDIVFLELSRNKTNTLFDLYNWIMEGNR